MTAATGLAATEPGVSHRRRPTRALAVTLAVGITAAAMSVVTGSSWLLLPTGGCLALCVQALMWPTGGLRRLTVSLPPAPGPTRVVAGEAFRRQVQVHNLADRPSPRVRLTLVVDGLSHSTVRVSALPPGARAVAELDGFAGQRGVARGVSAVLTVDDPLRLVAHEHRHHLGGGVIVHPALYRAAAVPPDDQAASPVDHLGDGHRTPAPRRGPGVDLLGVRDWRTGDDRRRVHWRSTACPARAPRRRRTR